MVIHGRDKNGENSIIIPPVMINSSNYGLEVAEIYIIATNNDIFRLFLYKTLKFAGLRLQFWSD